MGGGGAGAVANPADLVLPNVQETAGGERGRAPGRVFGGARLGSVEIGLGCEPAQGFAEERTHGLPRYAQQRQPVPGPGAWERCRDRLRAIAGIGRGW